VGKTFAQKILTESSEIKTAKVGDLIPLSPTLITGTDQTIPQAIRNFSKTGQEKIRDPHKNIVICNSLPLGHKQRSEEMQVMRKFVKDQGIERYFELGRSGIWTEILVEEGYVVPGDIIVSADPNSAILGCLGAYSVSVRSSEIALLWSTGELWFQIPPAINVELTGKLPEWASGIDVAFALFQMVGFNVIQGKSVELSGDGVKHLEIADRFNFAASLAEWGATTVYFPPDEMTLRFLKERTLKRALYFFPDEDAEYQKKIQISLSKIEPLIITHDKELKVLQPDNFINEKVDLIIMGGYENCRLADFQLISKLMGYQKVHPSVRVIFIPATPKIINRMVNSGLYTIFLELGIEIYPPSYISLLNEYIPIISREETGIVTMGLLFRNISSLGMGKVLMAGPAIIAKASISGAISFLQKGGKK
jgi:3-isopropylmalate/(R)-2-methylmalate dehydratase large subunit